MATACLRFRRRLPSSPPPAPLEDDDLLSEILLRLPPRPSSLPRAAAVCRRWRGLVSDPAFHRRFRIHHRRRPPLLGFIDSHRGVHFRFQPALDAPDRLPRDHFSLKLHDSCKALGWRHGLALFFQPIQFKVFVWDLVAGYLHRLAVPPQFHSDLVSPQDLEALFSGAVLRSARDVGDHFQVVLVRRELKARRVFAWVYSSETGVWGDIISAPLPSKALRFRGKPAVLAGDCLHWLVVGMGWSPGTLEFDLGSQSLAMKLLPKDMYTQGSSEFMVMRAEGGGLGFLSSSGFTAQLWSKKTNCDGAEIWELGRTIELEKLLRLKSEPSQMVGYGEENNVVFFRTVVDVFMVHLESLKIKKLSETNAYAYHPLEIVYTPGIGGGNKRAEVVRHSWWTRWRQYIRQLF